MRAHQVVWVVLTVTSVLLPARLGWAEHRMAVVAGLGVTVSAVAEGRGEPDIEGSGIGGFAEAKYYYRFAEWVRPTVYSGLHITVPREDCEASVGVCDVSAQFLFAGGQLRLMAPIPYFGLFFETGVGASLGNFSVRSGDNVNEGLTGATFHVPLAVGVMLGEHHEFEISLRYLLHPGLSISGGIGLGFDFALESPEQEESKQTRPPLRLQRPSGWHPDSPAPQ